MPREGSFPPVREMKANADQFKGSENNQDGNRIAVLS
jgi:hypothetical protein